MNETLLIDGDTLTVEEAYAVAVDRLRVDLAPKARERMLRTRAVVDDIVNRNSVVYGVTTGFGKLSEVAIPPEKLAASPARMATDRALRCSGTATTVGSLVAATTVRVIAGGAGVVCAVAGAAKDAALSSTSPKVLKCMSTSRDDFLTRWRQATSPIL